MEEKGLSKFCVFIYNNKMVNVPFQLILLQLRNLFPNVCTACLNPKCLIYELGEILKSSPKCAWQSHPLAQVCA